MSRPFSFSPETSSFRLPFEAGGDGFHPPGITWFRKEKSPLKEQLERIGAGIAKGFHRHRAQGSARKSAQSSGLVGASDPHIWVNRIAMARECTEQAGILNLLQEVTRRTFALSSFSTSRWTLTG
jgi:hypothetical protein